MAWIAGQRWGGPLSHRRSRAAEATLAARLPNGARRRPTGTADAKPATACATPGWEGRDTIMFASTACTAATPQTKNHITPHHHQGGRDYAQHTTHTHNTHLRAQQQHHKRRMTRNAQNTTRNNHATNHHTSDMYASRQSRQSHVPVCPGRNRTITPRDNMKTQQHQRHTNNAHAGKIDAVASRSTDARERPMP